MNLSYIIKSRKINLLRTFTSVCHITKHHDTYRVQIRCDVENTYETNLDWRCYCNLLGLYYIWLPGSLLCDHLTNKKRGTEVGEWPRERGRMVWERNKDRQEDGVCVCLSLSIYICKCITLKTPIFALLFSFLFFSFFFFYHRGHIVSIKSLHTYYLPMNSHKSKFDIHPTFLHRWIEIIRKLCL